MPRLIAICSSARKGTAKRPVQQALLVTGKGLEGDGHYGFGHRQVSLLRLEDVEEAKQALPALPEGAFGENLIVEGLEPGDLTVGRHVQLGPCRLRVTQLGKVCHDHCRIWDTLGRCIMPERGVFLEVLQGGTIRPGDELTVLSE